MPEDDALLTGVDVREAAAIGLNHTAPCAMLTVVSVDRRGEELGEIHWTYPFQMVAFTGLG